MGDRMRYKGRFIKKKVLDKKIKIKDALQKKREGEDLSINTSKPNLCEGIRLVDLKFLGKKLKCVKCFEVLCLDNVVDEQNLGLNSILKVKCTKCDTISTVPTGKTHRTAGNKSKHSDINTGIVLGAVHAGYGCSGLNKILACANIPTISPQLFKRYEREVGPAIEEAAKESCKRAAKEERQLVDENIDKLCLSPLKGVLSDHMLRKMASQAVKYQDLINKYENGGINGLIKFCKEPGSDNKPKISKDKRVIDKLCTFFTGKV